MTTYVQVLQGATNLSVVGNLFDAARVPNARMWGAKGDGESDDTDRLQQAITKCLANGDPLYVPPGIYLISAPLVVDKACAHIFGAVPVLTAGLVNPGVYDNSRRVSTLKAASGFAASSTGAMIHVPNDGVTAEERRNLVFRNLFFLGDEAARQRGIWIEGACKFPAVVACGFRGIGLEAIRNDGGQVLLLRDVYANRGYMAGVDFAGAPLVDYAGVIYNNRPDALFDNVHAGHSGPNDSPSGLIASFLMTGVSNCRMSNCVAENADVGCLWQGTAGLITNGRFELCGKEGLVVTGQRNQVTNASFGITLSSRQDGTYDALRVTGSQNLFVNLSLNTTAGQVRHFINDESNVPAHQRNQYVGIYTANQSAAIPRIAQRIITKTGAGTSIGYAGSPGWTNFFDAGGGSINVDGVSALNFTPPATVTNLLNGVDGQVVRLQASNGTTYAHGTGNLRTQTGANKTVGANVVVSFIRRGGVWYEV
ncbi:glycosyl hydrolase family 28-related protein [Rhodoligotrophos defluvii]|uniref:glycosyl hydrolase family 28-related protein n=1 Tax=Rhodoligotrophos defluvii TaxID=2561934 RepID=UPI0010C96F90|nr:glycosyl hydrolase family 28-related protein [Rhodoligotrophos defluvii]